MLNPISFVLCICCVAFEIDVFVLLKSKVENRALNKCLNNIRDLISLCREKHKSNRILFQRFYASILYSFYFISAKSPHFVDGGKNLFWNGTMVFNMKLKARTKSNFQSVICGTTVFFRQSCLQNY